MHFRDYRKDDFKEVSELWDELDMGGKERGDSAEIIDQTLSMGGKLIILEDESRMKIVGTSWMTFDGRRIFLHHFGIRAENQGKGWGAKLAMESLKFIRSKGNQVKLEVHKNNFVAKKLYEKAGFSAFTDYDIYMIRKPAEIRVNNRM